MKKLLTNCEFFIYEQDVMFRRSEGEAFRKFEESDTEFVNALAEFIETFYPKAYNALSKIYQRCAKNRRYYLYRITSRFIRCNFAKLDNMPDIAENLLCNFEYVECPLRGDCEFENIVCRPEFNHKLSTAELRVLELWYHGETKEEIAEDLYLSPHTVSQHIRNAYSRLGIHSKAQFIEYANKTNLFK